MQTTDRDVLMDQMKERFEEEFAQALDAREHAPDGYWIEASAQAFRAAALTVAREGLEGRAVLQARLTGSLEPG